MFTEKLNNIKVIIIKRCMTLFHCDTLIEWIKDT